MIELFVRYAHFVSILALCSMLVLEYSLLKPVMTRDEVKRFVKIDNLLGLSAACVLAAGLTLWFAVGKPAAFYSNNWVFHLKLGIFATGFLFSIYPTIFFSKAKKTDIGTVAVPKAVKFLVRAGLFALVVIPLLAVFMARGIGLDLG